MDMKYSISARLGTLVLDTMDAREFVYFADMVERDRREEENARNNS